MPELDEEVTRLRAENAALKQAARLHELRLRTLIESLPFDFWMMDESGHYVAQNAASRRHWGEVVGAREAAAGDPAVVAEWQASNRRAFAGETVRSEVEYEHGGERRQYLKDIAPVLDEGRARAILGINLDITDSKRLAAQIERNGAARLEAARRRGRRDGCPKSEPTPRTVDGEPAPHEEDGLAPLEDDEVLIERLSRTARDASLKPRRTRAARGARPLGAGARAGSCSLAAPARPTPPSPRPRGARAPCRARRARARRAPGAARRRAS